MKSYKFETSKGTATVEVFGDYYDGCKDVSVNMEDGTFAEFEEIDTADEIFEWMDGQGIEFESNRAKYLAKHIIESVLIDGGATVEDVERYVAKLSDEFIASLL